MGFSGALSRQRPALTPCPSRNGGGFLGARLGLSAHSGVTCAARTAKIHGKPPERRFPFVGQPLIAQKDTRRTPLRGGRKPVGPGRPPHILMATQEPHRLPETLLSPPILGKVQGKGVFSKTEGCFRLWDGVWLHCCEIRADHMVFPLKGREAGYASYCMFLWLIRDISQ